MLMMGGEECSRGNANTEINAGEFIIKNAHSSIILKSHLNMIILMELNLNNKIK
jgi:hypothetical protein